MLNISDDRTYFGATYIGTGKIKGKLNKSWKEADFNLIKFETNLGKDLNNIDAVRYLWGGKNMSAEISEEARLTGGAANVYALTGQEGKFEKIDPSKIVCLMSTGKIQKGEDTVEVFKIGTHPRYAYEQNRRSRDVKHIARATIEAFRELAEKSGVKPVVYVAEPQDAKFLQKVGLEPLKTDVVEFIGK